MISLYKPRSKKRRNTCLQKEKLYTKIGPEDNNSLAVWDIEVELQRLLQEYCENKTRILRTSRRSHIPPSMMNKGYEVSAAPKKYTSSHQENIGIQLPQKTFTFKYTI